MLHNFIGFQLFRSRVTRGILVALGLVMSMSAGLVSAQGEEVGITPLFGDGKLTIAGAGFKPGENVTITVKLDDRTHQVKATADSSGGFRIETGLLVKPLSNVELDARGDQGTGKTAITSVSNVPMPQTGLAPPSVLPIVLGGMLLALIGVAILARQVRT